MIGDELIVSDPTANSYKATPGVTLNEIAQLHSVTVQELRDWNKLPAEAILVNGTIYVTDPTGDKKETEEEEEEAAEVTESTESTETTEVSSEELSEETTNN